MAPMKVYADHAWNNTVNSEVHRHLQQSGVQIGIAPIFTYR
jgi:hypothetical protein